MKKRMSLGIVAAVLFMSITAFAEVQPMFNFQGKLIDPDGTPYTGTHDITLSIYDVATGGTSLRSAVYRREMKNGYFNIQFGTEPTMDLSTLSFETQYYIGVRVDGFPEMSTREKLGSVAYARWSKSVADNSITASKIVDGTIIGAKVTTTLGERLTGNNIEPHSIFGANISTTPGQRITNAGIEDGAVTQAKAQFASRVYYNGGQVNYPIIISGNDVTDNLTGMKTVTFPCTFTHIPNVVCVPGRGDNSMFIIVVTNVTTNSFTVKGSWPPGTSTAATTFYWIAVGY